jgi:cob(I)alamin adenosyltransferase
MWYGSLVRRHGRSRPLRRYQSSSRRRNRCRSPGSGRASAAGFPGAGRFAPLEPFIIPKPVKIYTKTGDDGDTGLFGGVRVSKADPRVAAYGEVDELNAWLGFARAVLIEKAAPDLPAMLEQIQRDLFAVGARLADPARQIAERVTKAAVGDGDIARLERWIDELEAALPPLRRFILAGGSPGGAALHVARTACRRAERAMVALLAGDRAAFERELLVYINRLSDLLFVMARSANRQAGTPELEW